MRPSHAQTITRVDCGDTTDGDTIDGDTIDGDTIDGTQSKTANACPEESKGLTRMHVGVQGCFDVMYRSRIRESIVRTQSMASQSLAVRGSWSVVRCLSYVVRGLLLILNNPICLPERLTLHY